MRITKFFLVLFFLLISVTVGASPFKINHQHAAPEAKNATEQPEGSLLFVLNAAEGDITKDTLTLRNVSDTVVYFSDRPERIAGHVTLERFFDYWNNAPDNFDQVPPNAVLSIVGDRHEYDNVVVVLKKAVLDGTTLTFDIDILSEPAPGSGTLHFKGAPLFIDGGFPCFIPGC